jgi:hypothetical protein
MGWLEDTVEEQIRPEVKLLRENGFNTECSCHHEMYIQCQFVIDAEIKRLHDLLCHNGYTNYTIEAMVQVIDGHPYPTMQINFQDKPKVSR